MAFGVTRHSKQTTSNVVALNAPQCRQPRSLRLAAHAEMFTRGRRSDGDVLWLKENAEFLSLLSSTGQCDDGVLDCYAAVHDRLDAQLGAFPQYYRFHLSICLDLEDLGMTGDKATAMCHWAASQRLAEAELSDLQRAEARWLLGRRGVRIREDGLSDRLLRFVERSQTFALPNRKAAYELTHVVFYLSEYGRRELALGPAALQSLHYAGLLAFLDQNMDLLAEICVALRLAGQAPNAIWERSVLDALGRARDRPAWSADAADDYHTYLMSTWVAGMAQHPILPLRLQGRAARIDMSPPAARPLRDMSLANCDFRCGDWNKVRWRLMARMDANARRVLADAERSAGDFERFYAVFARTSAPDW